MARRNKASKEVKLIFIPLKSQVEDASFFCTSDFQCMGGESETVLERRAACQTVEEYKKKAEIMTKWIRSVLIRK